MNASLSRWATCLNIGSLICLLGSAGNFAQGPASLHDWLSVVLPFMLGAMMLWFAAGGQKH
jgi:hypothetical protein